MTARSAPLPNGNGTAQLRRLLREPASDMLPASQAAPQSERALVRVAHALRGDEEQVLLATLERHFRRSLHLEIGIDRDVLGGIWVRVGDIVIDGSLRGKLETLRHHLRTQCRSATWSGALPAAPEDKQQ